MVCLDTSFVIDILRGNKEVDSILDKFDNSEEDIYVTTPTIMEIVKGAYLKTNIHEEIIKIKEFLMSIIIFDFNEQSAFKAGEIEANLRKKGEMIDLEDIMIAAIAIHNKERLITRNKKHFERIKGLEIESY